MNIATVLRSWRHHEELTIREAAKRIGIHYATLHRFESGKPMDQENLSKLLCWLLG